MASHGCSLSRPATCLAGLRRLAISSPSVPGSTITAAGRAPAAAAVTTQTRAKSSHLRPQDRGVLVRLLEDIPKFGRKGAIFRTERGRMRNEWFPTSKAEYLTSMRLRALDIKPDDIGERDRAYFPLPPVIEVVPTPMPMPTWTPTPTPMPTPMPTPTYTPAPKPTYTQAPAPKPKPAAQPQSKPKALLKPTPKPEPIPKPVVEPLTYAQIHSLINKDVPAVVQINRRLAPSTIRISPLVASRPKINASTPDLLLDGPVSTDDVLGHIRKQLEGGLAGRPLSLKPEQVRFVDLPRGVFDIKTTGTFKLEFQLAHLNPIVKTIQIGIDSNSLREYNA